MGRLLLRFARLCWRAMGNRLAVRRRCSSTGRMHFANLWLLDRPRDDPVRVIGAIVETRRTVALPSALWVVEWVFVKGHEHHQALLRAPVTAGLAALAGVSLICPRLSTPRLATIASVNGIEVPKRLPSPLLRHRRSRQ